MSEYLDVERPVRGQGADLASSSAVVPLEGTAGGFEGSGERTRASASREVVA